MFAKWAFNIVNNEPHNEGAAHCEKAHCSTMRALGLIVGTLSRAHCAINHNESNTEPINNEAKVIVGLIKYFFII